MPIGYLSLTINVNVEQPSWMSSFTRHKIWAFHNTKAVHSATLYLWHLLSQEVWRDEMDTTRAMDQAEEVAQEEDAVAERGVAVGEEEAAAEVKVDVVEAEEEGEVGHLVMMITLMKKLARTLLKQKIKCH